MRMTRFAVTLLLTFCYSLLAWPLQVTACQAVPLSPAQLSTNADVIVRVIPVSYAKAPEEIYRTTGLPNSTVEFRVEEVLKGENVPITLVINGYLSDKDDFNDRPVPYDFIRPGGRHGSCIANSYKKGAEFLLFLKKNEEKLNPYWAALTPVNEQLRSSDDPWLKWVRDYLQTQKEEARKVQRLSNFLIVSDFQWLIFPFANAI
jgi:hypothetical protein